MKNLTLYDLLSPDPIDVEQLTSHELDQMYNLLNLHMSHIHQFVLSYTEYMNLRHEYTDNLQLTMLESHLLTDICDIPNSTVTSLSAAWNRSMSATSQTVRKLMQKELIYRENSREDAKVFYLHPTELGRKISAEHKRHDTIDALQMLQHLRYEISAEEGETMLRVVRIYTDVLRGRNRPKP